MVLDDDRGVSVYKEFSEKVFKYFDSELFRSEIPEAKKDYFEKIGQVFDDDNIFEMRMAAFFDWFVYDRPAGKIGLSPIRLYYYINENLLTPEEKITGTNLLKTNLSLFLINKKTKDILSIIDLYDSTFYEVPSRREFDFIAVSSIVEGRLIPTRDGYVFSDPIYAYPTDVSAKIKKEALKYKNTTRGKFREFIFKLAGMSIRSYRYKHLPVSEIYKFK